MFYCTELPFMVYLIKNIMYYITYVIVMISIFAYQFYFNIFCILYRIYDSKQYKMWYENLKKEEAEQMERKKTEEYAAFLQNSVRRKLSTRE